MHHYIVSFQVLFLCELSATRDTFEFWFYAALVFQMGYQIRTIFVLFFAFRTVKIERAIRATIWKKYTLLPELHIFKTCVGYSTKIQTHTHIAHDVCINKIRNYFSRVTITGKYYVKKINKIKKLINLCSDKKNIFYKKWTL